MVKVRKELMTASSTDSSMYVEGSGGRGAAEAT